jgi:hypothetical protein
MYLTKDKISNALVCADFILAQPEVYADVAEKLPISIDAVTDFIAAHCKKTITVREVNFEATHLKGRKETYVDGNVFIDIRQNLPDYSKRFVALKELMHIIVDGAAEDLTPYGDVILEKLVLEGHIGVFSGNGDEPPAQSELVAEIAAIEVIYPIALRSADAEALERGETTLAALEVKYEAPAPIISTALERDGA